MAISRLFTEHPASVGETYLQHMAHAVGFASRMLLCGAACMVHAFLPFLFATTGSRAIIELNDRMILSRGNCEHSPAGHGRAIPGSSDPS